MGMWSFCASSYSTTLYTNVCIKATNPFILLYTQFSFQLHPLGGDSMLYVVILVILCQLQLIIKEIVGNPDEEGGLQMIQSLYGRRG